MTATHALTIIFWATLLISLAITLQLIIRPNWQEIVAALRGERGGKV